MGIIISGNTMQNRLSQRLSSILHMFLRSGCPCIRFVKKREKGDGGKKDILVATITCISLNFKLLEPWQHNILYILDAWVASNLLGWTICLPYLLFYISLCIKRKRGHQMEELIHSAPFRICSFIITRLQTK